VGLELLREWTKSDVARLGALLDDSQLKELRKRGYVAGTALHRSLDVLFLKLKIV